MGLRVPFALSPLELCSIKLLKKVQKFILYHLRLCYLLSKTLKELAFNKTATSQKTDYQSASSPVV